MNANAELTTDQLIELIAEYALDKKAQDVLALDLRGLSGFTDAFVVCSGTSDRQAKAIHDAIHYGLKKDHGLLPRRVEGLAESRWILMDYLDVVVHVFTPEARDFYRLEALWGDVPRRHFESGPDGVAVGAGAGAAPETGAA
jgi:ribosome-associated protein